MADLLLALAGSMPAAPARAKVATSRSRLAINMAMAGRCVRRVAAVVARAERSPSQRRAPPAPSAPTSLTPPAETTRVVAAAVAAALRCKLAARLRPDQLLPKADLVSAAARLALVPAR